MITCRKCGFNNENSATYCLSCFETIPEEDRAHSHNTESVSNGQEEDVKIGVSSINYQEKLCKICSKPIESGEQMIQCEKCSNFYHRNCYETNGGCVQPNCSDDMVACRYCGKMIKKVDSKCRFCGEDLGRAVGPQSQYTSKGTCSEATYALVFGILSLVCCGVIFGPLAISKGNAAIEITNNDPSYQGKDMAQVGKILGIVGLVLFGLQFVFGILAVIGSVFTSYH
jgi:hypothetical protein